MRAVYRCSENPYLSLSKGEAIYKLVPSYGDRVIDERGNYNITGMVKTPVDGVFQFMGGTLTLTDPTEIKGMREYIKRRRDNLITELSFEGDEAELENVSYIMSTEPQDGSGIPQGIPQRHSKERSSDWDYKMAQRIRR